MVRKLIFVALMGSSLTLAACNTVRGVGEDLGSVANETEDAMN